MKQLSKYQLLTIVALSIIVILCILFYFITLQPLHNNITQNSNGVTVNISESYSASEHG